MRHPLHRLPHRTRPALAIGAVLAAIVALTAVAGPTSASPDPRRAPAAPRAARATTVSVDVASAAHHPLLSQMGYDLKQDGHPQGFTPEAARTLFGPLDHSSTGLGFHLLRISLEARRAQSSPGLAHVDPQGTYYGPTIKAIKTDFPDGAWNALTIFGSLKSFTEGPDFPGWVTAKDGAVMPSAYATLLFQYLQYMDLQQDITIDVLGVDNEGVLNDGDITPARFVAVVNALDQKIAAWNKAHPMARVTVPRYDAPDSFGPDTSWVDAAKRAQAWRHLTYAGMHYYSKNRGGGLGCAKTSCVAALAHFAATAHANHARLWETEFHWNTAQHDSGPSFTEYKTDLLGFLAAADHADAGPTGFTWWAFQAVCPTGTTRTWCSTGVRGQMHTAVARSMADARPTSDPVDGDGPASAAGHLTTRAFVEGHTVRVWLVDDGAATVAAVKLKGFDVPSGYRATYEQWRLAPGGQGDVVRVAGSAATPDAAADSVKVRLPAHSMTVLTLTDVG